MDKARAQSAQANRVPPSSPDAECEHKKISFAGDSDTENDKDDEQEEFAVPTSITFGSGSDDEGDEITAPNTGNAVNTSRENEVSVTGKIGPIQKDPAAQECPICLESFGVSGGQKMALRCGHQCEP